MRAAKHNDRNRLYSFTASFPFLPARSCYEPVGYDGQKHSWLRVPTETYCGRARIMASSRSRGVLQALPMLAFAFVLSLVNVYAHQGMSEHHHDSHAATSCSGLDSSEVCARNPACAWCGPKSLAPPLGRCFDPKVETCCSPSIVDPFCQPNATLCSATEFCSKSWELTPVGNCSLYACCTHADDLRCGQGCYNPHDSVCCGPEHTWWQTVCDAQTSICCSQGQAAYCCTEGSTCCFAPDGEAGWCCPPSRPVCNSSFFDCSPA